MLLSDLPEKSTPRLPVSSIANVTDFVSGGTTYKHSAEQSGSSRREATTKRKRATASETAHPASPVDHVPVVHNVVGCLHEVKCKGVGSLEE